MSVQEDYGDGEEPYSYIMYIDIGPITRYIVTLNWAFFAVLLAFFLVPTPAFQIAPAYADELGEAVSAGLMESAQPADSPATPKVDTSTETVTQDKADPAPDTKDTAKGDALMGLDPQTPAAPAAPEASTSDKASEEAPETDAASTPDVDASVQDDAADVATEDETELLQILKLALKKT